MKDKVICVVCGGQTSEREVSLRTGRAVYNCLLDNGYNNVVFLDIDFNDMDAAVRLNPDVCFNALHGKVGENGELQRFLDANNIPYTGTGAEASKIAFDKIESKRVFESANIPTPEYVNVNSDVDLSNFIPCVIKPSNEGSTVGISIVKDPMDLNRAIELASKYDSKILAEKFIDGKEFTVSVFEGEAYPPIWIKPRSGFYNYESKYTKGATEYLFDLGISDEDMEAVKDIAIRAYKALNCKGVARVDMMYDTTPYILEVNTVPGMTETSLLPKAANHAGISFLELIEKMLKQAFSV